MGSSLSCLRSKHGTIHESSNICISLGKAKKPSMPETDHTISTAAAEERNKRGSDAKKALLGLKNLIVRYACKLKIKNYLEKSGCTSTTRKKSAMKRAFCACISSEKRSLCTNGLFKMKSVLLKGGGGGDHGGIKCSNTQGHRGNNGGGVDGKKGHDQKKQQ